MPSTDEVQAALYLVIVVTSLGTGGTTAELCDLLSEGTDCSGRLIAFIVFSFFIAVLAAPLLVAYIFDFFLLKKVEVLLVSVVLCCSIVATAVGNSPRTGAGEVPALLSWFILWLVVWALITALKQPDPSSLSSKAQAIDHSSTIVPLTDGIKQVASTTPSHTVQSVYQTSGVQAGAAAPDREASAPHAAPGPTVTQPGP